MPKDRQPAGRNQLKVRVKTAKRRKASSTAWLERQLNDPYVARAKAEGYRARSAFKLIEMDDRYHLLKPGDRVVDLGAAPGGWSEVAAERVRSTEAEPRVVALDYLAIEPLPGVLVLQKDFLDEDAPDAIRAALGGQPADVVLSDMAAPTTGHRQTDHIRTTALGEVAADFAASVLRPGGHFVAKVFQGGAGAELLNVLKRDFRSVHHVKPPASRAGSVELYLVAKGFRGGG
ncbi:RlmE family RNA methyltransferase [Bosea sp. (in: a-proteobacteria)]|uniref:RlmE family RNA methyltransferase n=1 Tax=Bosea sp. (in: a-proteobacteria) TaxID=1871050 RepID=UPI002DDDB862|nr:RlmE family RNA methyltransferase [Bosea sp. (in: a-proteobacteria)]HEV2513236.1 RlmE family RNA methyltransferase [Bosea sp. (in: a-proteobacteria)]